MTTAPQTDPVHQVLSLWLAQGVHKNSRDPISGAHRIALEDRDARIEQLSKDARALSRLKESDNSEPANRLRAQFNPGSLTDMNEIPEVQSLRAFTDHGTPIAAVLDEIIVDQLTMTTFFMKKAAAADDKAEMQRLYAEADEQRESGLRAAARFRAKPPQSSTPDPMPPAPRPKRTKPKPMSQKLIAHIAKTFQDQILSAINHAVRVAIDSPNELPPDPLHEAAAIRPPVRFDVQTLRDAGCEEYLYLQNGPEADTMTGQTVQSLTTLNLPHAISREAAQKDRAAGDCHKVLSAHLGWTEPEQIPDLYPPLPIHTLWERHQPGVPINPLWLLLMHGPEGDTARAQTAAAALKAQRDQENDLERSELQLDTYCQVERRSHYAYQGPKPDWSLEQLEQIWNERNPNLPMPRSWRHLAPDASLEVTHAIREEYHQLYLYERQLDQLQDAIDQPQSASTIKKKRNAAQEALNGFLSVSQFATNTLREAQIDPPSPPDPEPLPPLRQNAKSTPTNQQAFALPGVRISSSSPRPHPRPRTTPPQALTATPLPLPI